MPLKRSRTTLADIQITRLKGLRIYLGCKQESTIESWNKAIEEAKALVELQLASDEMLAVGPHSSLEKELVSWGISNGLVFPGNEQLLLRVMGA